MGAALKPLVEAKSVRFAYPGGPPVICGVSLSAAPASLCAVIGSNGCGKSTLVRMFAGLLTPGEGEILLNGAELRTLARRDAARLVAYVPQSSNLAFPFTALEVVLTGRSPYTPRFRFEDVRDREIAFQALEMVEAAHLANRRVTELSGGERQMVSVARALAQQPGCLLLDEPSAALDLKHRALLVRTLSMLRERQGLTAIVVTHDLHLIDPVFDYVFALRRGELIAEGAPAAVLTDAVLALVYNDPYVRTRRIEGRTLIWSADQS
jgi:iron complex transport system ATP-binding protein